MTLKIGVEWNHMRSHEAGSGNEPGSSGLSSTTEIFVNPKADQDLSGSVNQLQPDMKIRRLASQHSDVKVGSSGFPTIRHLPLWQFINGHTLSPEILYV